MIANVCVVWCVLFTTVLHAQQNVTYNGKTFKKAEVAIAQVGRFGESFSFNISEHDMSPNGAWAKQVRRLEKLGKTANPENAPKGYSLHLSVTFKNGFSFPIKPTDSVVISLSNIKYKLDENKFTENEINKIDIQKIEGEKEDFTSKKESMEAKGREIAQLMQDGKITPEEAMKRIEALTKPFIEEIEKSDMYNVSPEDYKESSHYDILFGDSIENIEAIPFEGMLHIVEFNKNKLVAYIKGTHIVECTDVARQNSPSGECKQVTSTLDPRLKVLKEEPVYLSINSTFNEFRDNRD